MAFIHDDFLLQNDISKHLYHTYAEGLPIIDYHCHLPVEDVAADKRFSDAADLFLSGDHYKWRQMRTAGIDESLITGDAPAREKFRAYAKMMPSLFGNPLYHWTHLELKRYFGIDEVLSEKTADEIFDQVGELLASDGYTARGLIARSGVEVICTTDDPLSDLAAHEAIAASGFGTKVLPTFRPDLALHIEKDTFVPYMNKIGVTTYDELLAWLSSRLSYFVARGCRVSDHSLETVPFAKGHPGGVFQKKMQGAKLTKEESDAFQSAVMLHLGREYAKYGLVMQLHIGAQRNNNARMFRALGPDTGFDSIGDAPVAEPLAALLSSLDEEDALPKTVLYNLNPGDNYVLGTMIGNFQRGPVPAKIQFGAAWWFNDQKDGMEAQMKALAALGMLPLSVGMLTDSRSFVSYPRHEYFRRIFCDLVGCAVARGEYPNDEDALAKIVRGVCYENAKNYFGF